MAGLGMRGQNVWAGGIVGNGMTNEVEIRAQQEQGLPVCFNRIHLANTVWQGPAIIMYFLSGMVS